MAMNGDPNQKLKDLLSTKLSSQIISVDLELGDVVARIESKNLYDFLSLIKLDSELKFDMFLSVTAIDWLDKKPERFELVYHLLSLSNLYRLRVKSFVSEQNPEVASVSQLWSGANFMEREVWDMYGIKFTGHPDLRRILMYEEFVGHPLRKDYPLQAKQPRIKLRAPEVENTARDMVRPPLVKINAPKKAAGI